MMKKILKELILIKKIIFYMFISKIKVHIKCHLIMKILYFFYNHQSLALFIIIIIKQRINFIIL